MPSTLSDHRDDGVASLLRHLLKLLDTQTIEITRCIYTVQYAVVHAESDSDVPSATRSILTHSKSTLLLKNTTVISPDTLTHTHSSTLKPPGA